MYRTRSYRRQQRQRVIERRLRFAQRISGYHVDWVSRQPNRFAKRKPLDCGKTRCYWCHGEKLLGIQTIREKRLEGDGY